MGYKAQIVKYSLLCVGSFLLLSCQSPQYEKMATSIDDVQQQLKQYHDSACQKPYIVEKDQIYSVIKPSSNNVSNPEWLSQHVSINEQKASFQQLLKQILRSTPAYVEYDQYPVSSMRKNLLQWATFEKFDIGLNVNKTKILDYHYSGSVLGALRKLAAQSGTAFTVVNNKVVWSRFEVKTFDIPFIPAKLHIAQPFSIRKESKTKDKSAESTLDAALDKAKSLLSGSKIPTKAQGKEPISQSDKSVWRDINSTLKGLVSKEGTFHVSEATTTVTVKDYPSNIAKVTAYFNMLQNELQRQVRINVVVLEIRLNKKFSRGINWDLVYNHLGDYAATSTNTTYGSLAPPGSKSSFGIKSTSGGASGSQMIIDALSEQGQLSVVTQPSVVTLNVQPARISILSDKTYLKSISAQNSGVLSTASTNYTMTPGTVTTGFSLYMIPKIMGKKVYLDISCNLSVLDELTEVSTAIANAGASVPHNVTIQTPKTSSKNFEQRSILSSGSTLILAGFKQISNKISSRKFFDSDALGGKSGLSNNTQTVLLITPTILHS